MTDPAADGATPLRYSAPSTIEELVALLAGDPDATLIAGGQSLLPSLLASGVAATHLVDIRNVERLRAIEIGEDEGSLHQAERNVVGREHVEHAGLSQRLGRDVAGMGLAANDVGGAHEHRHAGRVRGACRLHAGRELGDADPEGLRLGDMIERRIVMTRDRDPAWKAKWFRPGLSRSWVADVSADERSTTMYVSPRRQLRPSGHSWNWVYPSAVSSHPQLSIARSRSGTHSST